MDRVRQQGWEAGGELPVTEMRTGLAWRHLAADHSTIRKCATLRGDPAASCFVNRLWLASGAITNPGHGVNVMRSIRIWLDFPPQLRDEYSQRLGVLHVALSPQSCK